MEVTKNVDVFKMRTTYDDRGNSPWDALWYDGDDCDIDVLKSSFGVARVWNPPPVRLEKRELTPDIYVFQLGFAITERVRRILLPLTTDSAEFLPLRSMDHESLFALHPLLRVDLDERAIVSRCEVGGNIAVIRKYSFQRDQLAADLHVFQVRQAPGSAGRDTGYACCGVLVSSDFKELCEANRLIGVNFDLVWSEPTTTIVVQG